jgi:membrane protein insertase Oxa1/YidC/SpoIIIJ
VVYFAASQIFRIGQQALILRMDVKRSSAAPKQEPERNKEPERGKEPERRKEAEAKPPSSTGGREPGKPAARRPQGSKKGRGKRRRRK